MGIFQIHPDGWVYIRADKKHNHYQGTFAEFEQEFGVTLPPLPAGCDEQYYEQGVRHFYKGDDVFIGGERVWPEGDALIARLEEAKTKMKAREEAKAKKVQDDFLEMIKGNK